MKRELGRPAGSSPQPNLTIPPDEENLRKTRSRAEEEGGSRGLAATARMAHGADMVMLSSSDERGATIAGVLAAGIFIAAALVGILQFLKSESGFEGFSRNLSLKVTNHREAEELTRFIFDNDQSKSRLDRPVNLRVRLEPDVVKKVKTDPPHRAPFLKLATKQCPRARGRRGHVRYFVFLGRKDPRHDLDVNQGHIFLNGKYDITEVRWRPGEPTVCWANLDPVAK